MGYTCRMMKHTGDMTVISAVATERNPYTGELAGIQFVEDTQEAKEFYDSFKAHALLKVTIEVVSSVDGVIQPTKGNS